MAPSDLADLACVLNKRDTGAVEPEGRRHAVVRSGAGSPGWTVSRHAPSAALAHVVDYHWIVRWDLAEPMRQQVIPQPVVHLAAESIDGRARVWVHGVNRRRFERVLSGRGAVVASCLRPGGLRPFLGGPVSAVANRVVPAGELWATDDGAVAAELLQPRDEEELIGTWERWLLGARPRHDGAVDEVATWMDHAERSPDIVRAEQLAAHARLSLRTLERRFDEYVGVGPKWAIRRFRLLDAAAAAHEGQDVDWAEVATRLGFSDQAHLTRVFTEVVGTPPAAYRRRSSLG